MHWIKVRLRESAMVSGHTYKFGSVVAAPDREAHALVEAGAALYVSHARPLTHPRGPSDRHPHHGKA